jgi:DNA-binding transcriptional LysR family regulator
MQIKHLEDELGVRLLTRYPRGVRLTPAGTAFLREATDILSRADRAKHMARTQDPAGGGYLRMGYVPSSSVAFLPRLVRRVRAERPGAELVLQEMITHHQLHALHHHEIDVGFVRHPVDTTQVAQIAQLHDHFYLAVPADHRLGIDGPIDLRAAAKEVFVSPTRTRVPTFFDRSFALCADAEFSPDVRYEASSLQGVLTLVSAGLGVAIVPGAAALLQTAGVRLRLLVPETRVGALAFVHLADDADPFVAAVGAMVKDVFAELAAEIALRTGASSPVAGGMPMLV